jgi:hypothetical protein
LVLSLLDLWYLQALALSLLDLWYLQALVLSLLDLWYLQALRVLCGFFIATSISRNQKSVFALPYLSIEASNGQKIDI